MYLRSSPVGAEQSLPSLAMPCASLLFRWLWSATCKQCEANHFASSNVKRAISGKFIQRRKKKKMSARSRKTRLFFSPFWIIHLMNDKSFSSWWFHYTERTAKKYEMQETKKKKVFSLFSPLAFFDFLVRPKKWKRLSFYRLKKKKRD